MKICFRQLNKMITRQYFLTSMQMKSAQKYYEHLIWLYLCPVVQWEMEAVCEKSLHGFSGALRVDWRNQLSVTPPDIRLDETYQCRKNDELS